MESGDDGDGIYNGDGANDGRGRPNVDIDIEVVKDFLMDILKGVPAFRAIIATEATTPPPAREPPATGGGGRNLGLSRGSQPRDFQHPIKSNWRHK